MAQNLACGQSSVILVLDDVFCLFAAGKLKKLELSPWSLNLQFDIAGVFVEPNFRNASVKVQKAEATWTDYKTVIFELELELWSLNTYSACW